MWAGVFKKKEHKLVKNDNSLPVDDALDNFCLHAAQKTHNLLDCKDAGDATDAIHFRRTFTGEWIVLMAVIVCLESSCFVLVLRLSDFHLLSAHFAW